MPASDRAPAWDRLSAWDRVPASGRAPALVRAPASGWCTCLGVVHASDRAHASRLRRACGRAADGEPTPPGMLVNGTLGNAHATRSRLAPQLRAGGHRVRGTNCGAVSGSSPRRPGLGRHGTRGGGSSPLRWTGRSARPGSRGWTLLATSLPSGESRSRESHPRKGGPDTSRRSCPPTAIMPANGRGGSGSLAHSMGTPRRPARPRPPSGEPSPTRWSTSCNPERSDRVLSRIRSSTAHRRPLPLARSCGAASAADRARARASGSGGRGRGASGGGGR